MALYRPLVVFPSGLIGVLPVTDDIQANRFVAPTFYSSGDMLLNAELGAISVHSNDGIFSRVAIELGGVERIVASALIGNVTIDYPLIVTGQTTLDTALNGYLKAASGVVSAATTIPSTDITGLGTMSVQNANAVAIIGGSGDFTTLSVSGNSVWHAGNDGAASGLDADLLDGQHGSYYQNASNINAGTLASARLSGTYSINITGDAGTLDGIDSSGFMQLAGTQTKTAGLHRFQSSDVLEVSGGFSHTLEVYQDTPGADAFMAFHVGGDYAALFGLKGDINDFAVGGWSMGNTWYRVWHSGNDGSGSGLDADLVDGLEVHTGTNNVANRIVRTDANGYIQAGWINTISGDNGTTAISRIYASQDAYIRYYTPANFATAMNAHLHTTASTNPNPLWIRNSSPTIYFRDTDHRGAMILINSNQFYVLRGSEATDSTTWAAINGDWPLRIDLNSNDLFIGGNITLSGTNKNITAANLTASSRVSAASGFGAGDAGGTPALTASGAYGGGIRMLDGAGDAGFYVDGSGANMRFWTGRTAASGVAGSHVRMSLTNTTLDASVRTNVSAAGGIGEGNHLLSLTATGSTLSFLRIKNTDISGIGLEVGLFSNVGVLRNNNGSEFWFQVQNGASVRLAATVLGTTLSSALTMTSPNGSRTAQLVSTDAAAYVTLSGVQVLGARRTGWSTPSGTAFRGAWNTGTVAYGTLTQIVKAIVDDLGAHGIIGT